MKYRIWAEVSGGTTGFRAGWLRNAAGIREWTDRAAADLHAEQLTKSLNRPNAQARFVYTVHQYPDPAAPKPAP